MNLRLAARQLLEDEIARERAAAEAKERFAYWRSHPLGQRWEMERQELLAGRPSFWPAAEFNTPFYDQELKKGLLARLWYVEWAQKQEAARIESEEEEALEKMRQPLREYWARGERGEREPEVDHEVMREREWQEAREQVSLDNSRDRLEREQKELEREQKEQESRERKLRRWREREADRVEREDQRRREEEENTPERRELKRLRAMLEQERELLDAERRPS